MLKSSFKVLLEHRKSILISLRLRMVLFSMDQVLSTWDSQDFNRPTMDWETRQEYSRRPCKERLRGRSSGLEQHQFGWTRWLGRGKNKRWQFRAVVQDHQCCHESLTTPTVLIKSTNGGQSEVTKEVCKLLRVLLCLDVALLIKSTHFKVSCIDLSSKWILRNDLNGFYNHTYQNLPIINKVLKTKQSHLRGAIIPTVLCFVCNISVSTGIHGLLTILL